MRARRRKQVFRHWSFHQYFMIFYAFLFSVGICHGLVYLGVIHIYIVFYSLLPVLDKKNGIMKQMTRQHVGMSIVQSMIKSSLSEMQLVSTASALLICSPFLPLPIFSDHGHSGCIASAVQVARTE